MSQQDNRANSNQSIVSKGVSEVALASVLGRLHHLI